MGNLGAVTIPISRSETKKSMTAAALKFDTSSLELTDIERDVLTAMTDEGLQTYTDIANHLGKTADVVYSVLKGLIKQNIVTVVNDTPKRYYANDGKQPMKQPKEPLNHKKPEDKIDLERIEALSAEGKTMPGIARLLGLSTQNFERLAAADNELGASIRGALVAGEKNRREKKLAKPKPTSEAKTTEPDAQASSRSIGQDEEAVVVASEEVTPVEPVYLPNGPTIEKEDTLYRIGSIKIEEEPISDKEYSEAVEAFYPPFEGPIEGFPDAKNGRPHFVTGLSTLLPKSNSLTGAHIQLENGGTVSLEIHCDLFHASKLDRDLIDAIIEMVQAYENKKGEL